MTIGSGVLLKKSARRQAPKPSVFFRQNPNAGIIPQPNTAFTARKKMLLSEHFPVFVVVKNVEKKQENNLQGSPPR
ncbi:MAG: hypothetical protein JXR89_00460 [Deltaproteobacteria bacterium]|nr:hypothetical protein [Deltaproteobacteria bacterium]